MAIQLEIGKTYETSSGKHVTFFTKEEDCGSIFYVGHDNIGVKWWFEPNGRVYSCAAGDFEYWADDKWCLWNMTDDFGHYANFARLLKAGWTVRYTEVFQWKLAKLNSKQVGGMPRGAGFDTFEALMSSPDVAKVLAA